MLEELQSLDESTKRTILIISTIVVMIGVLYLWLGYFNGLVASNSSAPVTENTPQKNSPNGFGDAMSGLANNFGNAARWILDAIRSPGRYVVKPK